MNDETEEKEKSTRIWEVYMGASSASNIMTVTDLFVPRVIGAVENLKQLGNVSALVTCFGVVTLVVFIFFVILTARLFTELLQLMASFVEGSKLESDVRGGFSERQVIMFHRCCTNYNSVAGIVLFHAGFASMHLSQVASINCHNPFSEGDLYLMASKTCCFLLHAFAIILYSHRACVLVRRAWRAGKKVEWGYAMA